jgi:SPOR domain
VKTTLVVGLLAVLPPCPLAAQDNPTLKAAVQLAAEGRSDSARALTRSLLASARPGDPVYVEALYWGARFATTGENAERDLRRVAIEFSGSRYADHALLQLSQLALAAGNPTSALDLATRLRSDYPGSDLRSLAALWAGRAAFDVGEPRTACRYLDTASAEGAADVEFVNQVRFYQARCTAEVLAPPPPRADTARIASVVGGDSVTRAAPPAPPPTPTSSAAPVAAAGSGRTYEVQVAATRSERDARAVVRRLARGHREAHLARGSDGYVRVRVGPFPTLQAADSAVKILLRLIGGAPFSVRVP